MINLIDSIGVLIDESVDVVDIDKEDEFIMSIDDDLLTEGVEDHLADIGIVFEIKGGKAPPPPKTVASNSESKNASADRLEAGEQARMLAAQEKGMESYSEKMQRERQERVAKNTPKSDEVGSGGPDLDSHGPKTVASSSASMNARADRLEAQNEPGLMSIMTNAVKDNPILALGGVVIAAAGAYIIVKYLNSIYRLNKATNYYTKLASSTSDPAKKAKYAEKAKTYGARLDQAKSKARETKKDYIAKTKTMQSSLAEMKKSNADAKTVAKLEKKVTSRNKVLAKIGAL